MTSEIPASPRYIQANGLEFAYIEAGSGPLVLFLHGFPDTAASFAPMLPKMAAAGFRAVAVSMRGYAPTGLPERPDYSPLTLGRDVIALVEDFGARDACVVGHDWGALAAYAAAAMRPDRIRRIVTAALPHLRRFVLRPSRSQLRASRYMLRFQIPGADKDLAKDDFARLFDLVREWSPGWIWPDSYAAAVKLAFAEPERLRAALNYYRALPAALFRAECWRYLLKPLQVPARVIYGERDGAMLARSFQGQEHLFARGLDLVELPACGHFMHLEMPETFARLVIEYLQRAD